MEFCKCKQCGLWMEPCHDNIGNQISHTSRNIFKTSENGMHMLHRGHTLTITTKQQRLLECGSHKAGLRQTTHTHSIQLLVKTTSGAENCPLPQNSASYRCNSASRSLISLRLYLKCSFSSCNFAFSSFSSARQLFSAVSSDCILCIYEQL